MFNKIIEKNDSSVNVDHHLNQSAAIYNFLKFIEIQKKFFMYFDVFSAASRIRGAMIFRRH
jgi:hypothetical protein